jgi:hypothetical protein
MAGTGKRMFILLHCVPTFTKKAKANNKSNPDESQEQMTTC